MADAKKTTDTPTVIGSDAVFKGELTFQGSVQIDGTFEGGIQSAGTVYVSRKGKVKAEVRAGSIELDGVISGNVVASERVQLNSSGKLMGDLKAKTMQVQEGATFVGRCEVGPGAGKAGSSTASPMKQVQAAASGRK